MELCPSFYEEIYQSNKGLIIGLQINPNLTSYHKVLSYLSKHISVTNQKRNKKSGHCTDIFCCFVCYNTAQNLKKKSSGRAFESSISEEKSNLIILGANISDVPILGLYKTHKGNKSKIVRERNSMQQCIMLNDFFGTHHVYKLIFRHFIKNISCSKYRLFEADTDASANH